MLYVEYPEFCFLYKHTSRRLPRGGGAEGTPLQHIITELKAIQGYSVATVELTAHPLPTQRKRIYFIGVQLKAGEPEDLADDMASKARKLHDQLSSPLHHINGFLNQPVDDIPAPDVTTGDQEADTSRMATDEAEYATCFASALRKAIEKGSLDKKITVPPRPGPQLFLVIGEVPSECLRGHSLILILDIPGETRPSSKLPTTLTAWSKAQVDVYHLIVSRAMSESEVSDKNCSRSRFRPIADTSQTVNRGMAGFPSS